MAEYLTDKLKQFQQATATLDELASEPKTNVTRDAAIQRFEYTVESFWKLLKTYLYEKEGVDVYTPKSVFREAGNAGMLSEHEVEACISMIDDRNETVHMYNESLAEDVYAKIGEYQNVMKMVGGRITETIKK